MKSKKLQPVQPGEILRDEFLLPFGISMAQLAKDIKVPANRITQIVNGDRDITADTALRLSTYFETSPEFWLNLQSHYNLQLLADERASIIEGIPTYQALVA